VAVLARLLAICEIRSPTEEEFATIRDELGDAKKLFAKIEINPDLYFT